MSADNLIDRIPKDMLANIANEFNVETTVQQVVQALADFDIEATGEEAKALLDSLFAKNSTLKPIGDSVVDAIAGGSYDPWTDLSDFDPNASAAYCSY